MSLVARLWMVAFGLAVALPLGAQTEAETPGGTETAAAARGRPLTPEREQALRQKIVDAPDGQQRWEAANELSVALYRTGRVADSLKVQDDMLEDSRLSAGQRSLAASTLADAMSLLNERARANRLIARAKQLAKETPPAELDNLPRDPSYAFLSAEAEVARRETRHEVALARTRELSDLSWANVNDASLSDKRRRAANGQLMNNVAFHVLLLVQNNRRQEALSYVQEIERRIAAGGRLQATPVQLGGLQRARAIALCSFDDYDGAMAAVNASIATLQQAGVQEHEAALANAIRLRLFVALGLGRIGSHQADAAALERARGTNAVFAGSFAQSEAESIVFAARGDSVNAIARINTSLSRNSRFQGTESPFYKYQAAMLMLYQLGDPAGQVGVAEIDTFVSRLTGTDDWSEARYRGSYVEDGALGASMDRLMRPVGGAPDAAAQALAFRIAELLRVNASQGALADGAARLAANDPKLRTLIEQEQALRFEQTTSRRSFAIAAGRAETAAASATADPETVRQQADDAAKKKKALDDSAGKLKQLRRDISSQFPVYRELISPDIPTPAKLGASLRQGEVYVNLYAGSKASFVFVVDASGQLRAQRLEVTRDQLKGFAATLRASFDEGVPPNKSDPLGGFSLTAAHALYQAAIAPIQPQLQGASTVYLSSGLLSSVPWNVLLTRPATNLADAAWWASTVTPVQMPSASALVLARTRATKRATASFAAFADPSFDGQDRPAAAAPPAAVRQRAVARGAADAADYRRMAALPETLDEVRAIGTALGASDQSVVRGTRASRSAVQKQDLSDVRVVAFATHGLLPGELPGLLKPGLALAYEGQGQADSVLTIDDIVGLRLNADWVLLSACNTGVSSGAAGDTMSALSRGFFASGARALLVTQWAVESESAKELTVGLFKAYAAEPTLSKADALARVQRDMQGGKYGAEYTHPYYWAPYFLAGDAAR